MQARRALPAEIPWFVGVLVVVVIAAVERTAFQLDPSENTTLQEALDSLLIYGSTALGMLLPLLSARNSRELTPRRSAWIRVLLGCIWGTVAMVAAITLIAHNVDSGIGLFGLPIVSLICGVVALFVTSPKTGT